MALVPKPSSYVVDPSSPFGADCFGLERFAEALTDLVRHTQSSFVVNLEAPWGQGKTTFLEMWRHHLHGQKVQSLYFNAWETDFSTDPLIALIGELGESMASLSAAGSSAAAKHLEKLRKVGARLAMRSVPALIKAGTMGLLDLEDAIEGAIADAGEKVAEEEIKRYVESKQSIHKFREELALFAKALTERGDPASPLVIVIDELDRCRPDYAIKILETVKHFFAVQGVFFVIATDSKQLSNAIRHVYGLDVASEDYLRRFFDLSISMPLPSTEQFVPAQFARFGLDEFFKARTHHELRYDREQAIAALVAMFNATNCSLRDQMKCMTLLTISLRSIEENNYVHPLLLCTLIVLRVKRQRLFEQFVEGDVGVREVVQELSSSPPGRAFFSSSRGFGAVIYAYLIHATKDRLRRDSVVDSLRAASKSDDPGANADFARHVIEVMEHHSFRTSVHAMRCFAANRTIRTQERRSLNNREQHMGKFAANVLLLTALALPILLFWQVGAHSALSPVVAAAIAVAAGWALNVAWAFAANKAIVQDASQGNASNLKIALAFGWACPVVLVLLTWLVLRFAA